MAMRKHENRLLRVAALLCTFSLMAGSAVAEQQFIRKLRHELAFADLKGIRPEYLLTIAVLETGHGTGNVYRHTKNYFSIEAESGYSGKSYCSPRCYRAYVNGHQSISDVVRLFSTRRRYQKVFELGKVGTYKQFFEALFKSGYSENPKYAESLSRTYIEIQSN